MNFVYVFLGGGIGATARYWMFGCIIIGFLMTAFEERFLVTPSLRIFLTIGILGGFTTFSTFSFETISLIQDAEYYRAIGNIGLTLCSCLGGTYLGTLLGKIF
jgi:CrcB protein